MRSALPWTPPARLPASVAPAGPPSFAGPNGGPADVWARTTKLALSAFPLVRTTLQIRTPDRIRTGATALRGRRARPLHNGGSHCCWNNLRNFTWKPLRRTNRRPLDGDLAGILGLEPRLTGPEPVVLPITPYPTVLLVFGPAAEVVSHRRRTDEKPYTRGSERSKTLTDPRSTRFETPRRRAAQIERPR